MRSLYRSLPLAALLLPSAALASQPAEAVLAAMDLDMSLVSNITTVTAVGTSSAEMFDVRSSLGVINPYNAPSMGLMFTGNVNIITSGEDYDYPGSGFDTSAGDAATLAFDLTVPAYASSFSFNFYFLSREYPEWVGSEYNDTFEVNLISSAYTGQIVFDQFGNPVTVNNALFTVTDPSLLMGTGFDTDGGTGWVTTIAPCTGGETLHLEFNIWDMSDGVWDSAVLLDNLQFSEDDPPDGGPWTGDDTPDVPLELAFLSPKEGDVEGHNEVAIHGAGFDNQVSITWGGQPLDNAAWVVGTGGNTIQVTDVPPSSTPGAVDIRISRGIEVVELQSGYTYHDEAGGSAPPRITALNPDFGAPAGGTEVRVRGINIAEDMQVFFGEVEAAVVGFESDDTADYLIVSSPEHEAGWVEVVVVNGAGLSSDPGYPFEYSGDAPEAPSNNGSNNTQSCSMEGSAPSGALSLALALALLGIGRRSRREER